MSWDATWLWLPVYLIVGFIIAVAWAWRSHDIDSEDPFIALTVCLAWPVMLLFGIMYGLGLLIVVIGKRR